MPLECPQNSWMLCHNLDDFQCHILLELDFHFILLQCQKLESIMIFLILTQIFLIITSSLFQHPFLLEVLECTYMKQCITRLLKEHQKNEAFHPLWIELQFPKQSNIICGVINFYRQHNSVDRFLDYFEEAVDRYSATRKPICLLGDVNINILLAQTCNYAQRFLDCLQSYALLPTIDKPTRVYNNSATVIDNIFTNKFCEYFASGNIVFDITFSNSAYFSLLLKQLSMPK